MPAVSPPSAVKIACALLESSWSAASSLVAGDDKAPSNIAISAPQRLDRLRPFAGRHAAAGAARFADVRGTRSRDCSSGELGLHPGAIDGPAQPGRVEHHEGIAVNEAARGFASSDSRA